MPIDFNELYPNARLTYNGTDVTVYDVNPNAVTVVLDDGEIKQYVTDVLVANGEPYAPPAEQTPAPSPAATTAPATTDTAGQTTPPVNQTQVPADSGTTPPVNQTQVPGDPSPVTDPATAPTTDPASTDRQQTA